MKKLFALRFDSLGWNIEGRSLREGDWIYCQISTGLIKGKFRFNEDGRGNLVEIEDLDGLTQLIRTGEVHRVVELESLHNPQFRESGIMAAFVGD